MLSAEQQVALYDLLLRPLRGSPALLQFVAGGMRLGANCVSNRIGHAPAEAEVKALLEEWQMPAVHHTVAYLTFMLHPNATTYVPAWVENPEHDLGFLIYEIMGTVKNAKKRIDTAIKGARESESSKVAMYRFENVYNALDRVLRP
jgi:hypothetical protein